MSRNITKRTAKLLSKAKKLLDENGIITRSLLVKRFSLTPSQALYLLRLLVSENSIVCNTNYGIMLCGREEAISKYLESLKNAIVEDAKDWGCKSRCCSSTVAEIATRKRIKAMLSVIGLSRGTKFIARLVQEIHNATIIRKSSNRIVVVLCF